MVTCTQCTTWYCINIFLKLVLFVILMSSWAFVNWQKSWYVSWQKAKWLSMVSSEVTTTTAYRWWEFRGSGMESEYLQWLSSKYPYKHGTLECMSLCCAGHHHLRCNVEFQNHKYRLSLFALSSYASSSSTNVTMYSARALVLIEVRHGNTQNINQWNSIFPVNCKIWFPQYPPL